MGDDNPFSSQGPLLGTASRRPWQFVSADTPARYTPVTMKTHMETTMRNLARGRGAWDAERQQSTTATYVYPDGEPA